jgi:hypothetical protein
MQENGSAFDINGIFNNMDHNGMSAGPAQLSFPFEHDPGFLVHTFEKVSGRSVTLVLTDNSTSMLSIRKKGTVSCVRLHRMFLCADEGTLKEIALFIKHGGGSMTSFRAFVNKMRSVIRQSPPRSFPVRTQGKCYDLLAIFEQLNKEYFDSSLTSVITWGTWTSRKAVRKRTLGSYSNHTDIIRINPVLDKKTVPEYYIAFIVYHEMLHAALGIIEKGGRRSVHTRAFRERERLFKYYDKAMRWEHTR